MNPAGLTDINYRGLLFPVSKWELNDRKAAYRRAVKDCIATERLGEQPAFNAVWDVEEILGRDDWDLRNMYFDLLEKAYSKGIIYYMNQKYDRITMPHFGVFRRSRFKELAANYTGSVTSELPVHLREEIRRLCLEEACAKKYTRRRERQTQETGLNPELSNKGIKELKFKQLETKDYDEYKG
jgi:hypothetical protein